jgi:hypothetical protein
MVAHACDFPVLRGQEAMLTREIQDHAAALAGPNPTAIEASLAETAGLCLLALREAEAVAARVLPPLPVMIQVKDTSARNDARIEGALNRYLKVIRTLATVRRLALPSARVVNLAQNQVNPITSERTG